MPNISDILRITVKGTILGQNTVNVFFYRINAQDTANWSYLELLNEYALQYQTGITNNLSDKSFIEEMILENLTDNIGFQILGVAQQGTRVDHVLPSFNCIAVKLNRETKITRNGAKRFAGVSEVDSFGNTLMLPQANRDLIEDFCGGVIIFPTLGGQPENLILDNVIVGRTKNIDGVYEVDLARINYAASATVKPLITTQNSRKE